MFKSAVIKLTLWYVGALMLVCILFSLPIYNVAADRLRRGAEHQTEVVRHLPNPFLPDDIVSRLEGQREKQLSEDRQQLISSLLVTNLIIISAGAIASYAFARRTLRPIEDAHDAQVRFTSDASHELRTPLAVMQTEIEVALRNKQLTAAQAKSILTSNLEEVARLRSLSDQLLGLTRTQKELKFKKLKLDELVINESRKLEKRHKIRIKTDANNHIYINADPTLISQVLDILVDNAVKYSGKLDPGVEIKLAKVKDIARLTVIDNGCGIKPADLPRIFDRFYRGSGASKSSPTGHGLGLPLAKEIIERMDGEISVVSQINQGTQFTIDFDIIS